MKAGWQVKKLGEVCEKITDGTHNTPTYVSSGVPFLSVKNMTNGSIDFSDTKYISIDEHKFLTRRCRPERGDVLYTKVGTTGIAKTVEVDDEFSIFVSIALLKIKHELLYNKYLEHFLNAPFARAQARKRTRGMANKNLVITDIKEIEVHFPTPLTEQQRIVAIIDEAFDAIATAKANAEQNLKNARELFDSYLQSVFTQRGEGWVEKKLGDVCGFIRGPFGGSLKKEIFVEDGYAVYEQAHAIYDQFCEHRYFINEEKFVEMKRFELHPGQLIMSCSGTMGKVAIAPVGIKRGIINQALLILSPVKNLLNTFLKYWMESKDFQDRLREYAGGAAIQNVASVKILKAIIIPVPSLPEQHSIVARLDSLSAETEHLEAIYQQKIVALDELKQSLLHRAFAGEL